MKKNTILVIGIFMLSAITVPSLFALGSGALGNEAGIATKATAHGYSFAGVADDPSAIFYNPAGLAQVKGMQAMAGAAVIDFKSEHTTPAGQKDTTGDHLPVVPFGYFSYSQENSPWAFGVGVDSPFGLITDWKNDSFSKFYATESKLLMYAINPTVAYAVSESFLVGGGVDFVNVFKMELNQKVPGVTEGDGKFSGTGTGWGYNLGVLWKATPKHSFGLSYRGPVNVIAKGTTELSNISAPVSGLIGGSSYKTNSNTELKFPQSVLVGYGFRPTTRWTVFADYEWVNWSTTQETKFNYEQNNPALTQSINRNWSSTNNVGVGAEWKATEHVDVRFGSLIYEQVVPSSTLESSVPDAVRFHLTAGPGFHWGDTSLDLAYHAVFFKNRTITNTAGAPASGASMNGKFETMTHVVSLGLSQKWGGK